MGNREFDAQVVCRNKDLVKLSENFVLLRLSHMRGVNINLFKFDYDENWQGMFLDADGRIYVRYGSVDPDTRESHNSVEGLMQVMNAVLAIHKEESTKEKPEYKLPPVFKPEQIPAMDEHVKKHSCIECHMLRTSLFNQIRKDGKFNRETYWTFPPPDNIGILLDHKRGNVVDQVKPESFAAKAGIQAGDVIQRANGARVLSCADLRFVLEGLERKSTLSLEGERDGKPFKADLSLDGDWRRTSPIRKRAFQNHLRTKNEFPRWIFNPLKATEKEMTGIPVANLAIRLKASKNPAVKGGQLKGAFEAAGLREDDILIAFDGDRVDHYPRMPHYYFYIEHDSGHKVEVTYLRDGKEAKTTLVIP
jgi:hypothetical protein